MSRSSSAGRRSSRRRALPRLRGPARHRRPRELRPDREMRRDRHTPCVPAAARCRPWGRPKENSSAGSAARSWSRAIFPALRGGLGASGSRAAAFQRRPAAAGRSHNPHLCHQIPYTQSSLVAEPGTGWLRARSDGRAVRGYEQAAVPDQQPPAKSWTGTRCWRRRQRFARGAGQSVHNLSAMTPSEAQEVLERRRTGQRLCVRQRWGRRGDFISASVAHPRRLACANAPGRCCGRRWLR